MNSGAITKILLFIAVIGITVGYIRPTWEEIGQVQDDVYEIEQAVENAAQNNQELNQLISRRQSISQSSLSALDTFLPSRTDSLQLMADIANIATVSGVSVVSMSGETKMGESGPIVMEGQANQATSLQSSDITLTVAANYEQLKQFLSNIERNDTFLEVVSLSFGARAQSDEESVTQTTGPSYTMTLRTYAYNQSASNLSSN